MQYPSVQVPCAPHWMLAEQVPQVPWTQAMPPPHWLFAVQFVHLPLMQAYPVGAKGPVETLQSARVEHAPHTPLMHARPPLHPWNPISQPPSIWLNDSGLHTPDEQTSPEAQSPSTEQVHWSDVCVAAQVADGPHWLSAVQVVQV